MEMSQDKKDLFAAFSMAQAEIQDVIRDTSMHRGKYASLEQVVKEARRVLTNHGLSFTQMPSECRDGYLKIENAVFHKSGQYFLSTMMMPIGRVSGGISEAQNLGMVISYARRYGLLAMLGLAQEDDDAQLPQVKQHSNQPQRAEKPVQPVVPSPQKRLQNLIGQHKISVEAVNDWRENYGVPTLRELKDNEALELIEIIKAKFEV